MGQQQLLLVILGVILVGVAIAIGITTFLDNASSSSRDHVVNDLVNYASRAHVYYRKSKSVGGGGSSFVGITLNHLSTKFTGSTIVTVSGTYSITNVTATEITLNGKGTDPGFNGTNPVEVNMFVRAGYLTDSIVVLN